MVPKRIRAAIATTVAAALALTLAAPAAAVDEPRLLVSYDFGTVSGVTVPDVSGNGHAAQLRGAGAVVADGELRLPGGGAGSNAGFLQLPTGLFDGRDTLTISTWLRNDTGAGNYAAMFFGSASAPPAQYWLLNPSDPAGRFKSVVTNGRNSGAPWSTEAGISATNAASSLPGPVTSNSFALYTTVITPTTLTGYLNGAKIGTVPTSRTVSQFGTGLVSYVGRSSYNDMFFKGAVRDVQVWTGARTDEQIRDDFYDGASAADLDATLSTDSAALQVSDSVVSEDLDLPTRGSSGTDITWASSNPAVIASDGTVTRPVDADVEVTLIATLSLRGRSVQKEFTVTVAEASAQRDAELAAERFDLGITHVHADITLATSFAGTTVGWASSAPSIVSTAGKVTRQSAEAQVTLTATFTKDQASATRSFPITVLARDTASVEAYIVAGDNDRTDVLHLAASTGGAYTALNNGRGVLYPTQAGRKLGNPEHFRNPDGTFGLVAPVNSSSTQLYMWESPDLATYTNERVITFSPLAATRVQVEYDNGILAYRIRFSAAAGGTYEVTTRNWVVFSEPVATSSTIEPAPAGLPSGALEGSGVPVTQEEYDLVTQRLGRVVSTGVRAFEPVTTDQGITPTLMSTATVEYSSGSTTEMKVAWDQDDVTAIKDAAPGTYTIDGTVTRTAYPDPFIERRADPDVTLGDDGWYYFTASYPTVSNTDAEGYDRIVLRRAKTIAELKTAQEIVIWDEAVDPVLNRYIWAPELTKIGDSWYILFTAGRDPRNGFDIRPAMLKFTGATFSGSATQDPANWRSLGQVKAQPGDNAFSAFSLDMTHVEVKGRHYLSWAQYFNNGVTNDSTLYFAEINPADPTQLLSRSMTLSTPGFAWEKPLGADWGIDEGPAFIEHAGKIIASFSAATVDDKYAVGLLYASEDANLLDPSSWTKVQYPVLSSADFTNQVGPGHNSFTVDELGNPVIVYHARTPNDVALPGEAADLGLNDPRRHARAKTVHWDAQGLPVLNMTADEELRPGLERVQVKVTVKAVPSALSVKIDATPRCVAGKVTLMVTATNTSSIAATLTIKTGFSTKQVDGVKAGASTSQAISTRATSVPAGTATATATAPGATGSQPATAAYPALTCRA